MIGFYVLMFLQEVPTLPPTAPNPFLTQLLATLTPVFVPIVILLLKKGIAKLPSWSLPVIAIGLGVLADFLTQLVTGSSLGPMWGGVLGAAGVGLRELVDQTKKAAKPA